MWKPDTYSVIARLTPAVILLTPIGIAIWTTYPEGWPSIPSQVYFLIVPVFSFPLSVFVRTKGKKVQKKLWMKWGGSPLAIALIASRDKTTDTVTNRAVVRLNELFPDTIQPDSSVSEYEAVTSLVAAYTTEIGTRVVASENQAYGFYRNSYGIRPMGIVVSAGCFLGLGLAVFPPRQSEIWLALGVSGVALAWWTFGVKESIVREAGDRYANAVVRWLASNPED